MFVFEPRYFSTILNAVFWAIAAFLIVFISAKSILHRDSLTVLLVSSGILTFAVSFVAVGIMYPFWPSAAFAMSSILFFTAAILQASASIALLLRADQTGIANRKKLFVLSYSGILVFAGLISALAIMGVFPPFFSASGSTPIRLVMLAISISFLIISAIIFTIQHWRSQSPVLFWYALAMGVITVGALGSLLIEVAGDIPTWSARFAYFFGGVYILFALFKTRDTNINPYEEWSEAFVRDSRQLESFFSKMLNGVAQCRIVFDKSGNPVDYVFVAVNEPFEKMTGLRREQVIGKKVTEVLPGIEMDPANWIGIYGRVALTGVPAKFEAFSGSLKRWYSVSAYSPKKMEFISIFEDITERKKAEEALTESEQRWATTLSSIGDAVIATDTLGNIVFMNSQAEELTCWKLYDALHKPVNEVFNIVNEQTRLEVENPIVKVLKEGNICGLANHTVLIQKDGTELPIDDSGAPIKNKDGKTTGVVLIFRDITERKKTEEATARQAELIDLSPDAIIVRKLDGTITFWSNGAEKLYGWTKEEALGQVTHNLFNTQFPQSLEEILAKLKVNGKWSGEIVHTCKNGDKLVLQSFWLAKFEENDEIFEILESNVDITQRIELQTKLEESAIQLEEYASQMEELAEQRAEQLKNAERLAAIGATAGMVGHDIRNPLQAITSDVYLAKTELASTPDSEEKKNALESMVEIEKNIDYINKIVQDLQDYARPLNPKIEESDLKTIVNALITKNGLPKNIKVKIEISDEATKVRADSYYLNRILYNLVTNAVQAMPNGGKLTIGAHKEANDTVLLVEDTGVGIPKEIHDKMFTLMFTTKSKGQGFGLPVVKRMAESLGGTVTFESKEGKGTTFLVCLPPPRAKR